MRHIFIFWFILASMHVHGQVDSTVIDEVYSPRKNAIYLEIAGNGGLFSLSYDRLLLRKNKHNLIGRAGYGFLFNIAFIEANYNFGEKHCLEHGLSYGHDLTYHWIMYYRVGYRYRGDKGLLVRAAPLIVYNEFSGDSGPMSFWYGISIGYAF